MKINFYLILIIFIFPICESIDINDTNKDKNITDINLNEKNNETNLNKNDNGTNLNETKKEKKKKKKKKNKIREEEPKFLPSDSGVHINDTVFDEKLRKIIEEKNLKPNKKITKAQLKTIFVLIYKKEDKPGEVRRRLDPDPENELTPQEQSEKFMETLFNKVAKGLDYDDKIKVKDIKEWIPPKKTQEAYDELLYSLAEEMGYL